MKKHLWFLSAILLWMGLGGRVLASSPVAWDFTAAQVQAGQSFYSSVGKCGNCHEDEVINGPILPVNFPQVLAGFANFENLTSFIQDNMPGGTGGDYEGGMQGQNFSQNISRGQATPPFSDALSDVGNAITGRICYPACHRASAPDSAMPPGGTLNQTIGGEFSAGKILSPTISAGPFSATAPSVQTLPDGRYRLNYRIFNADGSPAAGIKVGFQTNYSSNGYGYYQPVENSLADSQGNVTFDELSTGPFNFTIILPSFSPAQAQELAAYILNYEGVSPGSPLHNPNSAAANAPGAATFAKYCDGCHGAQGQGGPGPSLDTQAFVGLAQAGPTAIGQFIANNMPPGQPNLLSGSQVSDLVNYLYDLNHLTKPGTVSLAVPAASSTESLYRRECSSCHGSDGTGISPHRRSASARVLAIAGTGATTLTDYPSYNQLESFLQSTMLTLGQDPNPSADVGPLTAYVEQLNGVGAYNSQVTPNTAPPNPKDPGEILYRAFCSSCHGLYGRGGLLAPPFIFGRYYSTEYIIQNMPPGWGGALTESQAELIAKFVDEGANADDTIRASAVPRRLDAFNTYCGNCHNGPWWLNNGNFASEPVLQGYIFSNMASGVPANTLAAISAETADLLWNFTGNAATGQSLYATDCASCHGSQGQGGAAGPALWGSGSTLAQDYPKFGQLVSYLIQNMLPNVPRVRPVQELLQSGSLTYNGNQYTLNVNAPANYGSHWGGYPVPFWSSSPMGVEAFYGNLTINGSPVSGATISDGWGDSAVTDANGNFTLTTQEDEWGQLSTLTLSYVIPGTSQSVSAVSKNPSIFNLDWHHDNRFLQPAVNLGTYLAEQNGLLTNRQGALVATISGAANPIETEPAQYTITVATTGGAPQGGPITLIGPGVNTQITMPSSGTVTVPVTIPTGQPTGNYVLTVLNPMSGATLGSLTINVQPPPVPTTISSLSATPGTPLTQQEVSLSGVIYDQYGIPVAGGTPVILNASGGYLAATTTTTGTNGSFSFTSTFLAENAGTYTLTATSGTATASLNLNVASNPLTFTLSPETLTVGQASTLIGAIYNNGLPLADGTSVSLTASAGTISGPVTVSGGSFSANFTPPTGPGTVFIAATWGSQSVTYVETVQAGPVALVVWSNYQYSSSSNCYVTATAEDAYGNLATGTVDLVGEPVLGYQTYIWYGGVKYTTLPVNFSPSQTSITVMITSARSGGGYKTGVVTPYVNGQQIPSTWSGQI